MKRIIFCFIFASLTSQLFAVTTIEFKSKNTHARSLKLDDDQLTYSALKEDTQTKKLNRCQIKIFQRQVSQLLKIPNRNCKIKVQSIQLTVENLVRRVNDCTGPLPRYESVLSEILESKDCSL